jgi:hypothetical protein
MLLPRVNEAVSNYFCLNGEPRRVEWVLGNGHAHTAPTDTRLHEFLPPHKEVDSGTQRRSTRPTRWRGMSDLGLRGCVHNIV